MFLSPVNSRKKTQKRARRDHCGARIPWDERRITRHEKLEKSDCRGAMAYIHINTYCGQLLERDLIIRVWRGFCVATEEEEIIVWRKTKLLVGIHSKSLIAAQSGSKPTILLPFTLWSMLITMVEIDLVKPRPNVLCPVYFLARSK